MPYFLHAQSASPDTGTPFTDKSQAIAARQTGQTITYLANDAERETWTAREQRRLLDKTYTPLPWLDDDGFPQKRYRVLANSSTGYGDLTPFSDHIDRLPEYYTISRYHFAHVSLRSDAMIAYTPSDEHGLADRQLRIRCGKYLDLVAPWLLPIEKDKLCARVRSMASATFKLATTPSEIRAVYRYGHGFSSCMDGQNFTADDDTNPVSAYGNSDLAVAYLGDIDSDDSRVTARVVVWPERKLYTRIYGDELLACLLKQDAWQSTDWEDDDPLTGAKIRAIRYPGSTKCYVMPYLDFANTVSLSRDGQHFVICDRDDPGEFTCRETTGRLGSPEIECNHCGRNFTPSEDGESDCRRCRGDMWMCDQCNESFYGDDDCTDVSTYGGYRINLYCERCATQLAHTCDRCNESFYDCQFSPAQHVTRQHDDLTSYCRSCADEVIEERTDEDPETPIVIQATDDTDTLPLLFAPSEDLKVYDCGFTSEVGHIVTIAPHNQRYYPNGMTVYLNQAHTAWFNCFGDTAKQTDFQEGERYQVMRHERSHTGGTYAWLRRLPVYDDRPWRDIPIGATVQPLTVPHHKGVKVDAVSLLWFRCMVSDCDQCGIQTAYTFTPPLGHVYRVLETAGPAQ